MPRMRASAAPLLWMERLLTVEFGPSRSTRFGKTVTLAQSGAGECTEPEPGRHRVRFRLSGDAAAYTGLARLLERVRHWRATEVYEEGGPVSVYHVKEMAWCASFYLSSFGECRERFLYGVLPRCALCPLFDAERAIRAGIPQPPRLSERLEAEASRREEAELILEPDFAIITDLDFLFSPGLLTQLGGELPDWFDLSPLIPDFPPEE
jgi:hypothetical protein